MDVTTDLQAAPYWAAMASGLQNAMCTMHFGAVVPASDARGGVIFCPDKVWARQTQRDTSIAVAVGIIWGLHIDGCGSRVKV